MSEAEATQGDAREGSEGPEGDGEHRSIPEARARRGRWIGLVWAVPLAALILVGFLGVRALSHRGIDVVVTFDTAAGARIGDTKVIYKGVEAGYVTKIDLNEDGHRVDLTLRLDHRSAPGLTTTAKFWLVGARPNLNDISSVKAAVAGLSIGVAPGIGGTPTRQFQGLSEPPIVVPGTPGTAYVLTTSRLATAQVASSIYYHGQEIGKIIAVHFTAPSTFRLDFFVFAPYDGLIHRNSTFWITSPVQVALTDKGASANLEHPGALFSGGIELDALEPGTDDSPSPSGAEFPLYLSRRDAEAGPIGPQVPYAFTFGGPGGELSEDSPVRLLGFQVGAVKSVRLDVDPRTGKTSTAVVAMLYPNKLQVPAPAAADDPAAWRAPTDAVVNRLLAQGHRAQLVQKPPLIGGRIVTLDRVAGAAPAVLGGGEPRLFPSAEAGGGVDEMTDQINQILAKVNRLPLDAIGQDARQITTGLNRLVSSPQLADSLRRLDSTLAQAEQMMKAVQPQVGPLMTRLNRVADELTGTVTAARGMLGGDGAGVAGAAGGAAPDSNLPDAIRELTDAARSIRTLADYLGRHPDALLRGRGGPAESAPASEPRKDGR